VTGLVRSLLRNRAFRQLMDAAPGWRELITLGKIWHLGQLRDDAAQRPLHELLVVDAPATGHGVTFLDVPRVVVSAVKAGPLRRNAGLVAEMVTDRERTLLLPVALAEELPARETAELVARMRDEIGVAVDRVVVNAVLEPPFPAAVPDLDARLARLRPDEPLPHLPAPAALARCAAHLRMRFELNRQHLAEIGRATGLPTIALPYLTQGIRGPDDLARLADALLATHAAEAA
jgi:anion-transporting  ArsA/GET3 family ATPase